MEQTHPRSSVTVPNLARYWEIDALRGLVVILMVFFHLMWDLSYFRLSNVDVFSTPWQVFARSIGATFTLLLGLSLAIRYTRTERSRSLGWLPYLKRGAQIFGLGLVVSLATYLAIGEGFVVFGILHMQGLALILAYPFTRLRSSITAAIAAVVIGSGTYLNSLTAPFPWLIWLGVPETGRTMVDYYPLLPWFGAALLGVALGKTLYPRGTPRFPLPQLDQVVPVRVLRSLGRRSLLIYLIHQPILLGMLIALRLTAL